jgi:DNA-binding transcriptional MerR regulator
MKTIENKNYYKMADLVKLTELSNYTIQFYAKKGLLPDTLSTSKNMKYYPEITLTVLNLIIYLKDHLSFSIDYIKELFDYFNVDFTNKGDLILQSIEMITTEIKSPIPKENLLSQNIQKAIDLKLIEDKTIYFKTEVEIIKTFNELLEYDVAHELIKEYINTSIHLAKLEKKLADKVIESKGELPEVLILNILNNLKPFIFNKQTIRAFED